MGQQNKQNPQQGGKTIPGQQQPGMNPNKQRDQQQGGWNQGQKGGNLGQGGRDTDTDKGGKGQF
jgi:hypothetical protein